MLFAVLKRWVNFPHSLTDIKEKNMENKFTEAEVKAAKEAYKAILEQEDIETCAIFRAGLICMWDEIHNKISAPPVPTEKPENLQLNNCPFCGDLPYESHYPPSKYSAKCHNCGLIMTHDRPDKLSFHWNQRPEKLQPVLSQQEIKPLELLDFIAKYEFYAHNENCFTSRIYKNSKGGDTYTIEMLIEEFKLYYKK